MTSPGCRCDRHRCRVLRRPGLLHPLRRHPQGLGLYLPPAPPPPPTASATSAPTRISQWSPSTRSRTSYSSSVAACSMTLVQASLSARRISSRQSAVTPALHRPRQDTTTVTSMMSSCAALPASTPTRCAWSSLIGSTSHIASSRDRLARRPPPRQASARTGAGTVGTTSSRHRGAAIERGHPGDQLGERERLREVVISPQKQTVDAILDRAGRRQHEHPGGVAGAVQAATQLVAMQARKVSVQDDDVVGRRRRLLEPAQPITGDVHRPAPVAKALGDRVGQVDLVLHDQQPHDEPASCGHTPADIPRPVLR